MRVSILGLLAAVLAVAPAASAQTLKPMVSGVVPVVSHTPGSHGTNWTTNVYITQATGDAAARVTLTIHSPGGGWTESFSVPAPMGSFEVPDVVHAVDPSIPDGSYVMTWWSSHPVMLSTSTFTTEAAGRYGQGIGSVEEGSGFGQGGAVIFPAPMGAGDHRVNVGVANAGSSTQVFQIESLDAHGNGSAVWNQTVRPFTVAQLHANEGMSGAGSVSLRCSSGCDGNAYGYASVVMNDSNDAYFLYAGAGADTASYAPVMTTRDDKGVWFITGGSPYDVFEANGYAVATDRLWQMETFRRTGKGTMAEIFGPDFLEDDILFRTITYSEEEMLQHFSELKPDTRMIVQAFVDGINRRVTEVAFNPAIVPFEFKALKSVLGTHFLPEVWSVTDVLALIYIVQRNFDGEATAQGQVENAGLFAALTGAYPAEGIAMFADLRWLDDPAALTYIPGDAPKRVVPKLPRGANVDAIPPGVQEAAARLKARWDKAKRDLEEINAPTRFGSNGWMVSGDKTASGRPTIFAGPQMGFGVPSIVTEGSIRGGGLNVSGMTVPGFPGILMGRTPHHAWAMQTGHAHTLDYYFESPVNVQLHRVETFKVQGEADVVRPIYRSSHGPIIEPLPYDPENPPPVIVSYAYAHWGLEHKSLDIQSEFARAISVEEFGRALEGLYSSFHYSYVDRDGNIAYWMSGKNPVRPGNVDPRLPLVGNGSQEWTGEFHPMPHVVNPPRGYIGGWNNKTRAGYPPGTNNPEYYFGPYHRAHTIDDYLSTHDGLSYEEVRDLVFNVGTTESFGRGGDALSFVQDHLWAAVNANPTPERLAALDMLDQWDRHFVAGGPSEWIAGQLRADAWVLQDRWIDELLGLVIGDEFAGAGLDWEDFFSGSLKAVAFNLLIHALDGDQASVPTLYDWFQDKTNSGLPTTAEELIVRALDNALAELGPAAWNQPRGVIPFEHPILGVLHAAPYSNRHTYAHTVELGENGPTRIESMFPLGESGTILATPDIQPVFDPHFFSMVPHWDFFSPRPFPTFDD
jgi:penicillin amidase